jgi:HK97 family phage major capsid protein
MRKSEFDRKKSEIEIEFEEKRGGFLIELRQLQTDTREDKLKPEEARARMEDIKSRQSAMDREYETRLSALNQEYAQSNAPLKGAEGAGAADFRAVAQAMREKRSITLGGEGMINNVRELFVELGIKNKIVSLVRPFYGPNSQTYIPVLSPNLAKPLGKAEGADISEDTEAEFSQSKLSPKLFGRYLPISLEALSLNSVNLEAELPALFAEVFGRVFQEQILTGAGSATTFKGLFGSIPTANLTSITGTPKLKDLYTLALSLQDLMDNAVIITHPAILSAIMSDTTAETQYLKQSIYSTGMINGVRIIATGAAPSSMAAGAVFAVAGDLSRYALGIASEIRIDPVIKAEKPFTYFRAVMFADGKPIIDKDFYGLTVAATP